MKHRVCSMFLALCCLLLLLTGCGNQQTNAEAAPWIPEGKGDLPVCWFQIDAEKGEMTRVRFTLVNEDGENETWQYVPGEGLSQIEWNETKETTRATLNMLVPMIDPILEAVPEEYRSGDEYALAFSLSSQMLRAEDGPNMDLVYSVSSGKATPLGAKYTGEEPVYGIFSITARLGTETQRRCMVVVD